MCVFGCVGGCLPAGCVFSDDVECPGLRSLITSLVERALGMCVRLRMCVWVCVCLKRGHGCGNFNEVPWSLVSDYQPVKKFKPQHCACLQCRHDDTPARIGIHTCILACTHVLACACMYVHACTHARTCTHSLQRTGDASSARCSAQSGVCLGTELGWRASWCYAGVCACVCVCLCACACVCACSSRTLP